MSKRITKKWFAVLLAAASIFGLNACAQSTSGDANTMYGVVTSIDGSAITLDLGTLGVPAPQGTPPDGMGGAPLGTSSPANDGQLPQGTPPAMQDMEGPQGRMLTLTGEAKTITVPDESVITVEDGNGEKTGLAAISVGSTLRVVFDADNSGTIVSIMVMGGGRPQGTGGTDATVPVSPAATPTQGVPTAG